MFGILLRFFCLSLLVSTGIFSTGCASITRGTKDKLKVISEPSGAQVTLSNGQTGTTPATFKLSRKKGVVVEVSKTGYEPQKVIVSSKFSGAGGTALAGNVLIGGLIGAGVDGLTGATLSLKPNPVSVTLIPLPPDSPPVSATEPAANTVAPTSPDPSPAPASAPSPDLPSAPPADPAPPATPGFQP